MQNATVYMLFQEKSSKDIDIEGTWHRTRESVQSDQAMTDGHWLEKLTYETNKTSSTSHPGAFPVSCVQDPELIPQLSVSLPPCLTRLGNSGSDTEPDAEAEASASAEAGAEAGAEADADAVPQVRFSIRVQLSWSPSTSRRL
ncbi:hypothetical protein BC938DRAFT_479989 [Jimgerdemannia flammicorona]|uniref:Uncharacterized protein n=1 Tax=Jimgerdemannia flammicorona TaxID=994334 RepID=A0A433QJQ4_9FUNG|nr:hypothetical protein BC938DRAFT_479989 [Jimgerdemannia flammicorona]